MNSSRIPDYEIEEPSKRDPTMETCLNAADILERLLQEDGFTKWGFVIYRCTYQSQKDWERFMARYLQSVTEYFEYSNGLDMLEGFTPTVFEDPSFDGTTTAVLRAHFRKWATTAPLQEQGVDTFGNVGRYRFFIMVDQEALESVLSSEPTAIIKTGFVRLVYGEWEPAVNEHDDEYESVYSDEELEPLEGCTLEDVGWMKVPYDEVEGIGATDMCDMHDWDTYYVRPPKMQTLA
jgi:hypothetical protein